MTIRSTTPGAPLPPPGGGSHPFTRKSNTTVSYGHRSDSAAWGESDALMRRMDAAKDNVTDSEYKSMLSRAADWTEDGPRIDSGNFPADKNW